MAVKHPRLTRFATRVTRFLGSNTFFYATIALFVVQAAWIAFSARYPQAFDEQYHFGIIKLYTHQLSPFFAAQPTGADIYSALTRDPSYLYHYLLSFPLRWTMHLTNSLTTQVIVLRLFSVALLAASLPVFRRVLTYTKASKALIHTALFLFVTTPVLPLLGSQINYDNIIILMTGLLLLSYLHFKHRLHTDRVWDWRLLAALFIWGAIGSLSKYAFLPIFAVVLCFVLVDGWQQWRRRKLPFSWPRRVSSIAIAAAVALFVGLLVQMYGYNVLHYYTPAPDCAQVLSEKRCQVYPPWGRNYLLKQAPLPVNYPTYPFVWLYHMMGELTFTIASGFKDDGTVDYYVGTQLIITEIISWAVFGLGVVLFFFAYKQLWRQPVLRLFMVVTAVYVAILFFQNFQDYALTGYPLGTHGRYLLPLLPLLYALIGMGVRKAIERFHARKPVALGVKASLASVLIVAMLFEGGGFVTYIFRSEPSWFWPQSTPVQKVNSKAKKLLKPIILDAKKG